jgi:hypothetical protein
LDKSPCLAFGLEAAAGDTAHRRGVVPVCEAADPVANEWIASPPEDLATTKVTSLLCVVIAVQGGDEPLGPTVGGDGVIAIPCRPGSTCALY